MQEIYFRGSSRIWLVTFACCQWSVGGAATMTYAPAEPLYQFQVYLFDVVYGGVPPIRPRFGVVDLQNIA